VGGLTIMGFLNVNSYNIIHITSFVQRHTSLGHIGRKKK
jgi:hypothetical protein